MLIRQAQAQDYSEVFTIAQSAFATAEHSDGDEHELIKSLVQSSSFIPELSLVTEIEGKIVGHILFTKIKIGNSAELALAPLSVAPEFQKRGIGSKLILEGHKRAKDLGYNFCVVLGSEKYYPRFGYKKASDFGIQAPFDVPDINFMAINLQGNTSKLEGIVEYDKAFNV